MCLGQGYYCVFRVGVPRGDPSLSRENCKSLLKAITLQWCKGALYIFKGHHNPSRAVSLNIEH